MAIYNLDAHTKSMQFKEAVFSASGIATERHIDEMKAMPPNLDSQNYGYDNSTTNLNNIFDQDGLMDLEVIAIDPDCFYSSEDSYDDDDEEDEAEVEDQDEDDDEDQNEHEHENDDEYNIDISAEPMDISQKVMNTRERTESDTHINLSASQTTAATDIMLDINIHDFDVDDANFFIDHHEEHILFTSDKNDANNFDLASYIAGDASSILLSPPPAEMNNKALLAIKMKSPLKNSPVKRKLLSNEQQCDNLTESTETQAKLRSMQENPRGRKRKLFKSVAIVESDSSDSESNDEIEIDVEGDCDNSADVHQWKKQRSKNEFDETWSPKPANGKDKNAKAFNEPRKNVIPVDAKTTKKIDNKQSIGLRQMLHKQMLSNRPVRSTTIIKKFNGSRSMPTEEAAKQTIAINRKPTTGLGRGKDINITAKYYKSSSDDIDDSDASDQSEDTHGKNVVNEDRGISKCENVVSNEIKYGKSVKNIGKIESKEREAVIKAQSLSQSVSVKVVESKNSSKILDKCDRRNLNGNRVPTSSSVKCIQKKASMPVVKDNKQPENKEINKSVPPLISSSESMSIECKGQKLTDNIEIPIKSEKQQPSVWDCEPDVKPKVIQSEMDVDNEVPKPIKRKLNIQEYLKRRNLNQLKNENAIKASSAAELKPEPEKKEHATVPTADIKTEKNDQDDKLSITLNEQSMYEEIIIVSMGCNTDISIPEIAKTSSSGRSSPQTVANKSSDKCAVLLSDIQDTLVKATIAKDLSKISSNSLLSSIQNVILTKSSAGNENVADKTENIANKGSDKTNKTEKPEHGENKIIMHLRKDRVRQPIKDMSMQTEPYFQFPLLEKLVPITKTGQINKEMIGNRNNNTTNIAIESMKGLTKHSQSAVGKNGDFLSESSYCSDDDYKTQRRSRYSDYYSSSSRLSNCSSKKSLNTRGSSSRNDSGNRRHYSKFSRNRTKSRSLSRSSDSSRSSSGSSRSSSSSSSATSRSSSSSSRSSCTSFNSYGDSSTTTNTRRSDQRRRRRSSRYSRCQGDTSPEERRIVYVGRLEPETTRDILRKKFSIYGAIKNISMHYKEGQYKYGFVTFGNASDAYTAIESGAKNPNFSNYDISFGGRRAFCKQTYLDLDNTGPVFEYNNVRPPNNHQEDSFEVLLKKMKERLQKTKD